MRGGDAGRQEGQTATAADLVILNAKVWTGSPSAGLVEAVAVSRGRIAAAGSGAEVCGLIGRDTRTIDAAGGLLVPGFNDAHVHLLTGGRELLGADFRAAPDERHFVQMLAGQVAKLPQGAWLTRGRWDHESWPGRRLPTRDLIDPVSHHHPVFLRRLDGHLGLANSLALRLAGVTDQTADPPGGRIVRDAETGRPTGVLIDQAMALVGRVIPPETDADRLAAARAALRHVAGAGVTSLQTPCSLADYRLFQRLHQSGELSARIYAILPAEEIQTAREEAPRGDEMLRTGAVKIFADGSFGAASALLFEPYQHDPSSVGLAIHGEQQLCKMVAAADAAGLQVALHAIGNKAVHLALNAFERALQAGGRRGARHRIEHAQMVRPSDRPRFAELGVIASLQPSHCIDDLRWIEQRLGQRCELAYPYRSLAQAGARIALGTDWDVEPLEPTLGLYAAVTREQPGGGPPGGWYGDEKVSIARALADYTAGSAYAEFQENQKGMLRPSMLADMALLSKDLLSVAAQDVLTTQVEMTFLGGRIVHPPGQ